MSFGRIQQLSSSAFHAAKQVIPNVAKGASQQEAKQPWLTKGQKYGLATLLGGFVLSNLPDDQKERLAGGYASLFQRGLNIPRERACKTILDCGRSYSDLMLASVPFYMLFPLIHKSGLVWHRHLLVAAGKGITGTLDTALSFAALYTLAPIPLLGIQRGFEKEGLSPKDAMKYSQILTFLVLASSIEFAIEYKGYGIPIKQMGTKLFILGTLLASFRMCFGQLAQHQNSSGGEQLTREQELQNGVRSALGTFLPQWLLNAIATSVKAGKGSEGVMRYLKTANESGVGTAKDSARQVGLTLLQRIVFCFVWNELSCMKYETPEWAVETPLGMALYKVMTGQKPTEAEEVLMGSALQRLIEGEEMTEEEMIAIRNFNRSGFDEEVSEVQFPSGLEVFLATEGLTGEEELYRGYGFGETAERVALSEESSIEEVLEKVKGNEALMETEKKLLASVLRRLEDPSLAAVLEMMISGKELLPSESAILSSFRQKLDNDELLTTEESKALYEFLWKPKKSEMTSPGGLSAKADEGLTFSERKIFFTPDGIIELPSERGFFGKYDSSEPVESSIFSLYPEESGTRLEEGMTAAEISEETKRD